MPLGDNQVAFARSAVGVWNIESSNTLQASALAWVATVIEDPSILVPGFHLGLKNGDVHAVDAS